MKKTVALLLIAITAFLGAVFQFRNELRDSYGKWNRGPVPVAISREEAQKEAAQAASAANAPAEKPTVNTNTAGDTSLTNTRLPDVVSKPAQGAPVGGQTPSESEPGAPGAAVAPGVTGALNLSVLFVPQAPKKNWDVMHEDACEEASMLMIKAYLNDTNALTLDEMEKGLTDIVTYETKIFGTKGWQSTDAEDTVAVMRDFLGLKSAKVVPISSLDDVRREIAKGFPVMLPTSGRLLNNPNFKNGGPPYHMLVAKGYTATTIITNDPGTRLGADYAYKNAVMWEAIHDWNGGDVLKGAKVMIVAE